MPQSLKSCGVLITRGDPIDSFLLMEHVDRWDLPKGHVDPGETDIECALREMEEETGIPRSAVQLDPDFSFVQRYEVCNKRTNGVWVPKTLLIFLGTLVEDSPITLTEHIGCRWFPWAPPHMIQTRAIDPLLEAVEAYLRDKP